MGLYTSPELTLFTQEVQQEETSDGESSVASAAAAASVANRSRASSNGSGAIELGERKAERIGSLEEPGGGVGKNCFLGRGQWGVRKMGDLSGYMMFCCSLLVTCLSPACCTCQKLHIL